MAFLDELASVLQASSVAGSSGSSFDLWRQHMADSTAVGDRAIALLDDTDEGEEGRDGIDRRRLLMQVRGQSTLTASTGYPEAEAAAIDARDALHEYTGSSDSDGRHYVGVWAEAGPVFIGFDESHRPVFEAEFRAWRAEST